MATSALPVKHGWVWLFAILIFFFNSFLLPEGVTLVLLLTPVWAYILYQQSRLHIVPFILFPLFVYAIIHLIQGVEVVHYFRSLLIICGLTTFLVMSYSYFNNDAINWDLIFKDIAILNIFLAVISLCLLRFPTINSIVWYKIPVSKNINLPRLKLFTEEASHYSFFFAPIAIYFYSRPLFFKTTGAALTLFIVTLPLIISFSLGVLACIGVSFLAILVLYSKRIFTTPRKRIWLGAAIIAAAILLLLAWRFDPGNPLFLRIHNIFNGDDTSARGRTYEAFILANKIIAQKSALWGIGLGQLAHMGREIIIQYYYYFNIPAVIRIPNASAETIIFFGYAGLILRLSIEVWLFIATRVYVNPYRMWLFLFVFIYQFTGSYITDTAEYLVWIIAFSTIFPEYENRPATLLKTERS